MLVTACILQLVSFSCYLAAFYGFLRLHSNCHHSNVIECHPVNLTQCHLMSYSHCHSFDNQYHAIIPSCHSVYIIIIAMILSLVDRVTDVRVIWWNFWHPTSPSGERTHHTSDCVNLFTHVDEAEGWSYIVLLWTIIMIVHMRRSGGDYVDDPNTDDDDAVFLAVTRQWRFLAILPTSVWGKLEPQ